MNSLLHDNDVDCVGNLFVSTFLFIYFFYIMVAFIGSF
jgi:hypothetical protein